MKRRFCSGRIGHPPQLRQQQRMANHQHQQHQKSAPHPMAQTPVTHAPAPQHIEARPMTSAYPGGPMQVMQGEELNRFWDNHCSATMGGTCHLGPDGVCTRCHEKKGKAK